MIKAIETKYKGCHFRSRLEARWAVFFDVLGLTWEYEKEGYNLGSAGWYLPDFWLPQWNAWFEVKPTPIAFGSPEWNKARALADSNHPVIVSAGNIGDEILTLFCWDTSDGGAGSSEWRSHWSVSRDGRDRCLFVDTHHTLNDTNWDQLSWAEVPPDEWRPHGIEEAHMAARSARFEYR